MSWNVWLEADLGAGPVEIEEVANGFTWNLAPMLEKALQVEGFRALDGREASVVCGIVCAGIQHMKADPGTYHALNPPNGWGNYEICLEVLEKLVGACERAPRAVVRI